MLLIQEHLRYPAIDPVMTAITALNDSGLIAIIACLLMLCIPKTRRIGVVAAASLMLNTLVVNVALKPLVGRLRPYDVIDGLRILVDRQSDFSFPSGHSAAGFAVAIVMLRLLPKRWGVSAVVLALLIALSRLYVGVHYPTDVLAGIAIGAAAGLVCCRLFRGWAMRKA